VHGAAMGQQACHPRCCGDEVAKRADYQEPEPANLDSTLSPFDNEAPSVDLASSSEIPITAKNSQTSEMVTQMQSLASIGTEALALGAPDPTAEPSKEVPMASQLSQDDAGSSDIHPCNLQSIEASGHTIGHTFSCNQRPTSTTVCPEGNKCRNRTSEHLASEAHPFDADYADLCIAAGTEVEQPSLRGLFEWVDIDSSGKVSKSELLQALPLLSGLFGQADVDDAESPMGKSRGTGFIVPEPEVTISAKAWERLDEDGNGYVNFSEFAEWAGPRLGLPLGVKHLFEGRAVDEFHGCAIIGCPCEAFVKKGETKVDMRSKTMSFFRSARLQENLQVCKCGHKYKAHNMHLESDASHEVPYPLYWDTRDSGQGDFFNLVEVDATNLELFQALADSTYKDIWTRDRKRHNPTQPNVPKGFSVVRAFRNENSRIWREYGIKRAQLIKDCEYTIAPDATADHHIRQYSDVDSSVAWNKHGGLLADRLKPEINEWYLFHGSNENAARNICENDFKFSLAGSNTGTLYGRGIYFAENITKADEYSKPNAAGEYAMILTRVVGGHVNYCDEVTPDAEELVHSCIEGPYDGILGDRRKCRGTYREFVFYDTENFYAEYVIHYTRVY